MSDDTHTQERIWGREKQEKLYDSNITIVGAGPIVNYILANLIGLQVRNIKIISNERISGRERDEFLLLDYSFGKSKVKSLEEKVNSMNPKLRPVGIHSPPLDFLLDGSSVIVDGTNDPISKDYVLNYSKNKNIPLVSLSCDEYKGKISVYTKNLEGFRNNQRLEKIITRNNSSLIGNLRKNTLLEYTTDSDLLLEEYGKSTQGIIPAGVLAGIAADEIRKAIIPLDNESNLKVPVCYNMLSKNRTSIKNDSKRYSFPYFGNRKILLAGAGALGTFLGLGLAQLEVGALDIIDDDVIDPTNVNRQIFYINHIGERKVDVLADALKRINPGMKINPVYGRIGENMESSFGGAKLVDEREILRQGYDLIFSSVDSNVARLYLNSVATRNKIPVIYGGTEPHKGVVTVYQNGITPCFKCQTGTSDSGNAHYNVNSILHENNNISSTINAGSANNFHGGCAYAHDASVIYVNFINAFLMLGETVHIWHPNLFGPTIKNQLGYNSNQIERLVLNETVLNGCVH